MRDQFLHQTEVAAIIGTAHDILFRLKHDRDDLHAWSLQDIIDLLSKGYTRDQIIQGFTRPCFEL